MRTRSAGARRRGALVALVVMTAGLAGCRSAWRGGRDAERWDGGRWIGEAEEAPDARPRLALDPADEAYLRDRLARREERRARAEAIVARSRPARHDVYDVAAAVAACYRAGARDGARALVDGHPRVVAWDAPEGLVAVECSFAGDGLRLDVVRAPAAGDGPVAVVFPPGTYAVAEGAEERASPDPLDLAGPELADRGRPWTTPDQERRYGHWPGPQDLALLRAPVVLLEAGVARQVVHVPVACASFHRRAPEVGRRYGLAALPAGSPIDRLLVALCAESTVPEAEAQLAVWLARDDIDWAAFCSEGGDRGRIVTFGSMIPVRARHAEGAARLLLGAGVDPTGLRFFGAEPQVQAAPDAPPQQAPDASALEPAPALEPTPDAPDAPDAPGTPAPAPGPVEAQAELAPATASL